MHFKVRFSSEKYSLIKPQISLRSAFLIWFTERLYYLAFIVSSLMILVNTKFEGPLLNLILAFTLTASIWFIGFIIFSMLRVRASASTKQVRLKADRDEFLAALSVVATIFMSLLAQKIFGYPTTHLWPLFYLALFASVERLSTFYYGALILSIWLSLFALVASTPTDMFSIGFFLNNLNIIGQCISILFLSIILLYLVSSLKHKDINIQAMIDLSKIEGRRWHETQYSYHILESIVTVSKYLYRALSCDIIFVNNQTGVCYQPPISKGADGFLDYPEKRSFFKPTGALLNAIQTGNATWDYEEDNTSDKKKQLLEWLSSIIPITTTRHLFLPIHKYPGATKVVAVLRLLLEPNILGIKISNPEWQRDFARTTHGFSDLLNRREIVQSVRIMHQINRIAAQGSITSLYKAVANDYAFLFACPTTLWQIEPDNPESMKIQTTSSWFAEKKTFDEYKNANIVMGEGKLGRTISQAQRFKTDPVYVLAQETEHASLYKELGIQGLIVIPLITEKGPICAVMLHILTEAGFDEGEIRLMKILALQTALAIERHRSINLYRELPSVIQKFLTTAESDPDRLIDILVQNAIDFLKAGVVDIHLLETNTWVISKSRRGTAGKGEVVSLSVTKEEEELLLEALAKSYPIFSSSYAGKYLGLFPRGIKSYALIPLSPAGQTKGILLASYWKPYVFNLEHKLIHNVFSLLAEHMLNVLEFRAEFRKKLASEERGRLTRKVHESISDSMLAIKNWAQTAVFHAQGDNHLEDLIPYLERINRLALDSYERLLQLPNELWSPEMDEVTSKGLIKAIEDYYIELNPSAEIYLEASGSLSRTTPLHVQSDLFRIGKLALSNIVRHASAKGVFIEIIAESKSVSMTIKDDGVGFDSNLIRAETSIGLLSIVEIAKELGGHCEISTAPGLGTVINIQIPLDLIIGKAPSFRIG